MILRNKSLLLDKLSYYVEFSYQPQPLQFVLLILHHDILLMTCLKSRDEFLKLNIFQLDFLFLNIKRFKHQNRMFIKLSKVDGI